MNFWSKYRKNSGEIFFYGVLFVIMNVMNYLTPIHILDDIKYSFVITNIFDTEQPIQSVSDIVNSMCNHWLNVNGRITTHFFVQLFTGLLGKSVFNIFNSFMFCLMIYLILKLTEYKSKYVVGELFLLASFLILMPSFNQTVLWLAGSINYLWSAVFVLLFLLWMKKNIGKDLSYKILFFAPVSLLFGWTHECLSLPVSMALGLYCLINIKRIYNRLFFVCVLFYIAGTILTVFAPSTLSRAERADSFSIDVKNIAFSFFSLKVFWVYIVLSIFFYIWKKDVFFQYVKKYRYLIAMAFFSLIIVFLMGHYTARATFGIEFFFLLLVIALLITLKIPHKRIVASSLLLVNLYYLGHILFYQKVSYNNFKYCEAQILDKSKQLVLTKTISMPSKWKDYVQCFIEYGDHVSYFVCDKDDYNVKNLNAYYGKTDMYFFPKDLYVDIKKNPLLYSSFRTLPDVGLYVKRINKEEQINGVRLELNVEKEDNIPFFLRPIASKMVRYSSKICEINHWSKIMIDNEWYLVFAQPTHSYSNRIKKIVIL